MYRPKLKRDIDAVIAERAGEVKTKIAVTPNGAALTKKFN